MVQTHPDLVNGKSLTLAPGATEGSKSTVTHESITSSSNHEQLKIRPLGFRDANLERLYQTYLLQLRKGCMTRTALIAIFFNIYAITVCAVHYTPSIIPCIIASSVCLLISILTCIILYLSPQWLSPADCAMPYVLWVWLTSNFYMYIGLSTNAILPNYNLGWQMVFLYTSFVLMPLTALMCCILAGVSFLLYPILMSVLTINGPLQPMVTSILGNMVST